MNSSMAIGFLLVASGMLLSLYLLLQAGFTVVLLLIVALFTLASSHALASLLAPASAALLPARLKTATVSLGPCGEAELATLLVWPLCLALAGTWFLCRRATWAWALQADRQEDPPAPPLDLPSHWPLLYTLEVALSHGGKS